MKKIKSILALSILLSFAYGASAHNHYKSLNSNKSEKMQQVVKDKKDKKITKNYRALKNVKNLDPNESFEKTNCDVKEVILVGNGEEIVLINFADNNNKNIKENKKEKYDQQNRINGNLKWVIPSEQLKEMGPGRINSH